MIAVTKAGGQRVDLVYAFPNRRYRLLHDNIFRGLDDFETRHTPIFFDSNFDQRRNLGAGNNVGRRLAPRAVKAVMQHVAIPPELRRAATAPGMATFAR